MTWNRSWGKPTDSWTITNITWSNVDWSRISYNLGHHMIWIQNTITNFKIPTTMGVKIVYIKNCNVGEYALQAKSPRRIWLNLPIRPQVFLGSFWFYTASCYIGTSHIGTYCSWSAYPDNIYTSTCYLHNYYLGTSYIGSPFFVPAAPYMVIRYYNQRNDEG